MSWFGEHFTSITEKISDFTKDVLNDASERVSYEGISSSFASASVSKTLFGNDAIDLKTQPAEENHSAQNTSCETSDTTGSNDYANHCDKILTNLENVDLVSNINVVTMLNCIKNCDNDNYILRDILNELEETKHSIEIKNSDDINYTKSLSKLNNYINYFKVLFDHREEALPFMREAAFTFEKLNSKIPTFHRNGLCGDCNKLCKIPEENQINFVKNMEMSAHTIQTDVIVDNKCEEPVIHSLAERASTHVQTDVDLESIPHNQQLLDNYTLEISKLKKQIKFFKEEAISQFSKESFSQQTDLCPSDTSSSQTDDVLCPKCNDSFSTVETVQQENEKLVEKICSLRNEIKKLKLDQQQQCNNSISLQTDLCKCTDNEVTIAEQSKNIDMLQQQLCTHQKLESNLESKLLIVSKLENDLNSTKKIVSEKDGIMNVQKDEILTLKHKISSLQKIVHNLTEKNATQAENNLLQLNSISKDSLEKAELNCNCGEQQTFVKNIQEQITVLQQQLKSVNLEKNQLLCMLNEKSQECSSLKTEVHRLTSIVASEKQALFKLQKDNKDLRQEQESRFDSDLTKEALQNLSRLVRDKDIEIEALKQKNDSLASVLQEQTPSPDHIQTLVEERESLTRQIDKFKADREKIMKSYNTKDQKYRVQQAEITTLTSETSAMREKVESLEQQLRTISLQYEEKQKSLMNTQNEMIILKQKVFELEQQNTSITEQHDKLLETVNSDSTITVSREEFTKNLNELETVKVALKDKNDLIEEKDHLIHQLSNDVKSSKLTIEQMQREMLNQRRYNEELAEKLKMKDTSVTKALEEKEAEHQRFKVKISELSMLSDMNNRLNMSLKENEFTIKALEAKISSLTRVIQEKTASENAVDVNQILSESKEMYNKAQRFQRERDETLLSLNQTKQENQELKTELQKHKSNEDHLKNELDRLRKHLLQIEENYTNEALVAEDREKELRSQLTELEASAKLSNSAVSDASHHANVQVASLQEQVSMIAQQRDQALAQLSDLEDKVQLYSISSNNLQLVLEKRQKEHDQKLKDVEKKGLTERNKIELHGKELEHFLNVKQKQLEESSQALEAASRLSEILDSKEEVINSLKENLSRTENSLRSAIQELESMRNNPDGKVDRVVMKSLVLGYFSTPPTQKSEVIRLLARVLDFNQEEMQKAGIVVSRNTGSIEHKGIFSSLFGRLPSLSIRSSQNRDSNSTEPSFTTLFVKFLENESQPIIRMPLPAEEMAQELTSKSHSNRRSSHSKTATGSPGKSPLLLNMDSAFPTFAALPAVDYNSPTILKEVLE